MSKKPKLTRTFPGAVKPVRDGVYQRNYAFRTQKSYWCYSNFQNGTWDFGADTPEGALEFRGSVSGSQELPWRGLASNPMTAGHTSKGQP